MKQLKDVPNFVAKHRIRPTVTAPTILAKIMDSRAQELIAIEKEADLVAEQFAQSMAAEDGAAAEGYQAQLTDLAKDWKEKKGFFDEARDDYCESHLAAEQARILGSYRRVKIKEGVIFALIFLVLGLLGYEYTVGEELEEQTQWIFYLTDCVCCVIFLTNFVFEHNLAFSKRWYWRTRWVDFVTSIPFPPTIGIAESTRYGRILRMLRLLRLARLARAIRALRTTFFLRGMDELVRVLDVRLMKRSLVVSFVVIGFGAAAIYIMEGKNEAVDSLSESLWWSFTTTITGGFGDIHNPSSNPARLMTVLLVLIGMILVGIFTATLTTVMMPKPEDDYDEERHHRFQDEVEKTLKTLLEHQGNHHEQQEQILSRLKKLEDGPEP